MSHFINDYFLSTKKNKNSQYKKYDVQYISESQQKTVNFQVKVKFNKMQGFSVVVL